MTASGSPNADDMAVDKQKRAIGESFDQRQIVRHKDDRLTFGSEAVEGLEALSAGSSRPHREDLVEQQDVEVDLNCDRVRETDLHAGGKVLQLLIDEPLQFRERDDVVIALLELTSVESEQRPVDPDVVPRRELRVEADSQLDERRQQPRTRTAPEFCR